MAQNEYIPGVCNIGRAEVTLRKQLAWGGLVGCLILGAGLVALRMAPAWRLVLFGPAMLAALGYLQARWHFCAKFGLGGVFNFGQSVGQTDTVEQAEFRKKDRQTAFKIIGLSVLFGAIIAVAAALLPL
jgi:hypothetical protein